MSERATAGSNLAKIEAHEKVCAERYARIDDKLEAVKEAQDGLADVQVAAAEKHTADIVKIYDLMWRVAFGVIGTLIASVVSLIGVVFLLVTKG